MKRCSITCLTLLAALLGMLLTCAAVSAAATASSAPAPASTPSQPPRASLTNFVCQKALDPPARAVSVTAVMRTLPDTTRFAVNFQLLEKSSGASSYTSVAAPGLGVWISKAFGQEPGDVWRVIHPVADLDAPAVYRFSVQFRWTDADGRVLSTVTRSSHACYQPEMRPDLTVNQVQVQADSAHPDTEDDYTVQIGDIGASGAGPFTVELGDAGTTVDKTVPHIDAHSTKTIELVGPLCNAADPPTVTVDPTDQVDVYSRAQATETVTCPAASGSPSGSSAD